MPDYNGTDESHVVMHMYGTVIDENYSLMLFANQNINLTEAVLLDQVQRDKPIGDEAIKELRKKHLIEGRKPQFVCGETHCTACRQEGGVFDA